MGYNMSIHMIKEDPRSIDKTITAGTRIKYYSDVVFKQGKGMQEITFEVQENPTASTYQTLMRANYFVLAASNIPNFKGYYYFVDHIEIPRTGLIRYHLREDVLMTWRSDIRNLTVTLDRSETIFNGYLPDSQYTALGYRAIAAKQFPVGLTNDNCILITTG